MSRYLIDTNIFGNLLLPKPSPELLDWMSVQTDESLFTTSITIAEIRRGILILPEGRKRFDLEAWFSGKDGPPMLFDGRILPFDSKAAFIWAEMMAEGRASGRNRSAIDTMIAAIATLHSCVVVTDNTKDFYDIETINPIRMNEL